MVKKKTRSGANLNFGYSKKNRATDEIVLWLESNGFDCLRPQSGMVTIYARRCGTLLAIAVKPRYRQRLLDVQEYLDEIGKVAKGRIMLVGSYDEFVRKAKKYAQRKVNKTKTVTVGNRKFVAITKGNVAK